MKFWNSSKSLLPRASLYWLFNQVICNNAIEFGNAHRISYCLVMCTRYWKTPGTRGNKGKSLSQVSLIPGQGRRLNQFGVWPDPIPAQSLLSTVCEESDQAKCCPLTHPLYALLSEWAVLSNGGGEIRLGQMPGPLPSATHSLSHAYKEWGSRWRLSAEQTFGSILSLLQFLLGDTPAFLCMTMSVGRRSKGCLTSAEIDLEEKLPSGISEPSRKL